MNNISSFIKYQRKKTELTQQELASKAGVGIRFIRELELGKETLQMDKVNQVLSLFGFGLFPEKQNIDAYFIFWNFFNKAVKITLSNKDIKYGIIIEEIINENENKISAWKFISNNNAIKYQQKKDETLVAIITHSDIINIEEQ
jgi:y4mF family transcriptional regulator